jgi:SEC-C motif
MRTLADHTANDVTAEDQAQYAAHVERWQNDLHPNGALECYFAAEIARATWRMERYSVMDAPDMSEAARAASLRYRNQTNAGIRRNLEELRRIQSNRYLQSHLGFLLPGVATLTSPNLKLILSGLKSTATQADPATKPAKPAKQAEKVDPAAVVVSETALHAQIQEEERRQFTEFAKRDLPADPEVRGRDSVSNQTTTPPVTVSPKPAAPRNALCPCNSGQKYKRCCGHWSKTTLKDAA